MAGNTVTLQWVDRSDVEDGFEIELGLETDGGIIWSSWATVPADTTSYSDTLADGSYWFRVRALRLSPPEVTDWSNEIELTVGAPVDDPLPGGGPPPWVPPRTGPPSWVPPQGGPPPCLPAAGVPAGDQ